MFRHLRPVWVEVNLDNLSHNMNEIKRISKSKEIIAAVKADAYGHGALDIVSTLLRNGATRLAVAVVNEAVELRRGGVTCPIMILGFTPDRLIESLLRYDIEQTVYNYDLAERISSMAVENNKIAKIHIALDTGMGRIGFKCDLDGIEQVYKISKLPNIILEGLFSHFSSADEEDKSYTNMQFEKFNWFYNSLKEKGVNVNIRHIANSAAIIDLPETHLEAIRPGIIMFGYYPSEEINKEKIKLKPVMSLKTNIVHIKKMDAGEYISYGRAFKTERKSVIATLPVGYADGYTRSLFGKAKVIVNGKYAPVIGKICMDQCMIDITEVPNVNIGDEVILMGEGEGLNINAEQIAEEIGTINYEVICMISKRVPRVYLKNNEIVKIRNYV
ncbi:alanine racemase [uncultured Clostridium sp.]|uniref:alanine racemase n=1 Tax=uncultured Clostridium sp. TaxID=59620 RepID=UPI0028E91EB1|nr:alanine racemase [uncultured Clostridium sp.]